ncbi:MAG: hypothetical protein OXU36_18900 [Candidatus Poribacteria bacterium]|nr:hypothetical protein [Candidatus Poribacteria bacterium]
MKYLVLLTALIALLSCGSDSNLISPDPSMDMRQPAEKNESLIVENPLVEPPEAMVEPPMVQAVPPEVIEVINENLPVVRAVPPEAIKVIVEPPNEDPPMVRVVVPPEVIEAAAEPPNGDLPIRVIVRVRVIEPQVMAEPPNEDPPMEQ